MSEKYTAEHFLRKFSATDDSQWCEAMLKDDNGRCCVAGHCGVTLDESAMDDLWIRTEESDALDKLLWSLGGFRTPPFTVTDASWVINDGSHPQYQQPTPRLRILAALEDVKGKQSGKE